MSESVPVEAFPPGDFICEELAARGQSVAALITATELPAETVHGVLSGTAEITAEIADRFGRFFDTSPALWTNLAEAFRDWNSGR